MICHFTHKNHLLAKFIVGPDQKTDIVGVFLGFVWGSNTCILKLVQLGNCSPALRCRSHEYSLIFVSLPIARQSTN